MSIVGIVVLAALLTLIGWLLSRRPQASDAYRIAGTPAISLAAESFYLGYISRHNFYRRGGGVVFVVASAILSWRSSQNVVLWGATMGQNTGLFGVIAFTAVFGLIAGGLLAETYRLRPPIGARQASLDARDPRPAKRLARWAWAITGLALVIALVAAVTTRRPALIVGLVPGLLAVGLAELVQTRLDGRRRPVLTEEAMAADRAIRRAMSESITWLELAAAILTLGWVGLTVSAQLNLNYDAWPGYLMGVAMLVCALAVVPAFICVNRGALARGGSRAR